MAMAAIKYTVFDFTTYMIKTVFSFKNRPPVEKM